MIFEKKKEWNLGALPHTTSVFEKTGQKLSIKHKHIAFFDEIININLSD